MPHRVVLVTGLLLAAAAGCAQTDAGPGFATRVIPDAPPANVFRAGQGVLRAEFGRLASSDPVARRAVSDPVFFETQSASGTARDLYGGASRMRRVATLVVDQRGESALVRLRVAQERQDTTRREVMQQDDSRLSDTPGYTPIERDAATLASQNTVWTFVRRDFALERELLDDLAAQFAPPVTPANTTAADEATVATQPASASP